jgi:hypothetical protein
LEWHILICTSRIYLLKETPLLYNKINHHENLHGW